MSHTTGTMDVDDEDDFYAPEEPQAPAQPVQSDVPASTAKKEPNEDLESGEEEDEGGAMDEDDDSDIDIITERKDGTQPAPPPQSRYSEIKNIPQRSTTSDTAPVKPAPSKRDRDAHSSPRQHQPPTTVPPDYPPISTSKIDVHAIPIHKPSGKPLTAVNIDEDLPADNDKPWRKPGTDLSDYFNYGFDEFTWALYAQKQEALRGEYNPDVIAERNKKMMEEMTNMMMMGGMGPMPGMPPGGPGAAGAGAGGAGGGAAGVPGMEGMSPELQAMMQQMMGGGMDPGQMDMGAMAAMFGGAGGGPGGGAGQQGGQGQGFGGGFGGGPQGQYGGYEQQMGAGGGGGGRGGRGRGRRW
ncbi:hypothetical protein VTI74DRAFT_8382 [Chaetomium olivicolor]